MRLDQVEAGMLLLSNINDPNGHLLVAAGVILSERHLKVLKSWGIQDIDAGAADATDSASIPGINSGVRSGAMARPVDDDPATAGEFQRLIDDQFSLSNPDHPAVRMLRDLCLERALRHR